MTFIVDKTLGKLATWLRILGYDTASGHDADLEKIVRQAQDEARTLLTKDKKLYKESGGLPALLLQEDNPFRQLQEVVRHFRLTIKDDLLFSRCLVCNTLLQAIDPAEAQGEVPDYIYHNHWEFSRCPSCRKIYWAGTHYGHMRKMVERLQEADW
ncbi:MAG: hypothetical protein A2Z19_02415 [Deltaproteobacteria bacterium RBG_16_54_18]|nr:MAG: hypothetical protein A2Z19_02415 [Deltaproteobacteria bacterium RBG_16_54_18]